MGHSDLTSDLRCVAVLGSVLACQAGLICLGAGFRFSGDLVAAVISIAACTWLSWPLWLTAAPAVLIRCHPLLAVNGVLADRLGLWTEQPVAYRIMSLGQDVPYTLPPTVWPAAIAHGGMGVLAWGASLLLPRRAKRL